MILSCEQDFGLKSCHFISIDGIDLPIEESSRPIDLCWFSHKLNRMAVRYKVGVAIQTGWIVWINGSFPAGEYSDLTITKLSLIYHLNSGEYYIADGRYRDGGQFSCTPTGGHSYWDWQMVVVHSCHKTINSRFKEWVVLSGRYCSLLDKHSMVF